MPHHGWPIEGAKLQFRQAFAMDTMAFVEWLQYVFIPRVREYLETGEFPESSAVGAAR